MQQNLNTHMITWLTILLRKFHYKIYSWSFHCNVIFKNITKLSSVQIEYKQQVIQLSCQLLPFLYSLVLKINVYRQFCLSTVIVLCAWEHMCTHYMIEQDIQGALRMMWCTYKVPTAKKCLIHVWQKLFPSSVS